MLGPPPEGDNERGNFVVAIRMVVRDRQEPRFDEPVGRAGVGLTRVMTIQHGCLYVCTRKPEKLRLRERVVAPTDDPRFSGRHALMLRGGSDASLAPREAVCCDGPWA